MTVVDIAGGEDVHPIPYGVCPECKKTAFTDLVLALGKLQEPGKGGKAQVGGRGTYTYLTLPDLLTAVRAPLAEHHLAVMQEVANHDGGVSITTVLMHASGYAFRSPTLQLRCGPGPQDIGSATTYGRRYTLAAMVGLAGAEDDDAQQATKQAPPHARPLPNPPEARPVQVGHRGGKVEPGSASPASVKAMWTLLRRTGLDTPGIRQWVANTLTIDPEWATGGLSQAQVSAVIDRLKDSYPDPPPEDDQ